MRRKRRRRGSARYAGAEFGNNDVHVAGTHNTPIDLDSEGYKDEPSRHRTCWKHTIASLRAHSRRPTKRQVEDLEKIKLSAPCYSETFPRRERSERRSKCKYAISKLKKELDTRAFESYMGNLWRSFSDDKTTPFTYLDCIWFAMYGKPSSRHKVLTWIKRKQIFSKRYVFVPIACWGHWSLLILCHLDASSESESTRPCMLLLDSLEMANPKRLEPDIRKFVLDIFIAEGRRGDKQLISQIPLLVPKVPQQRNDKECGNYVLFFIDLFVQHAPEKFSLDGYPYFMKDDWFSEEGLERFCEKLESLEQDPAGVVSTKDNASRNKLRRCAWNAMGCDTNLDGSVCIDLLEDV